MALLKRGEQRWELPADGVRAVEILVVHFVANIDERAIYAERPVVFSILYGMPHTNLPGTVAVGVATTLSTQKYDSEPTVGESEYRIQIT